MKTCIVLAACIVACVALPQMGSEVVRKPPVPILNLSYNNDNQGTYDLQSHGGDETKVQERGALRDLGDKEGPVNVKQGSYSYVGTDGRTYTVTWTADENGFQPQGSHLPTPPPIPEEIRRTLPNAPRM